MKDRRNFEVKFQEAKAAIEKFDTASGKVKGYAEGIIALAAGLSGDNSIAELGQLVKAYAEELEKDSIRMKNCAEVARDCIQYYENAEAKLGNVSLEADLNEPLQAQAIITPTVAGGQTNTPELKEVSGKKDIPGHTYTP